MIVLFLDIDGPIRHEEFFKKNMLELTAGNPDGLLRFDDCAIDNLNHIVEKTGAKVVISSSWRIGMELGDLQNLFACNGFIGEVIGVTPIYLESYTHEISRGKEIADWIKKNPVDNYCIIDDSNDVLEEQEAHFVLVDDKHGITEDDAEKAVQILST